MSSLALHVEQANAPEMSIIYTRSEVERQATDLTAPSQARRVNEILRTKIINWCNGLNLNIANKSVLVSSLREIVISRIISYLHRYVVSLTLKIGVVSLVISRQISYLHRYVLSLTLRPIFIVENI